MPYRLATALIILLAAPVLAAPAFLDGGATTALTFDIVRHGETIGSQSLVFHHHQGITDVDIDISVRVTALSLVAYRFEQHGTERWEDDQLKALNVVSDDNGEKHKVEAELVQGRLHTTVDGKSTDYPDMPPASLWRPVPPATTMVLDPVDGTPTAISTADAGWETITVRGKPVRAHHWIWSGDLERDLWYDAKDTLVRIRILGDDGSHIVYVPR